MGALCSCTPKKEKDQDKLGLLLASLEVSHRDKKNYPVGHELKATSENQIKENPVITFEDCLKVCKYVLTEAEGRFQQHQDFDSSEKDKSSEKAKFVQMRR